MIYCSTVPPTTLTKFEKEKENSKRKLFLLHGLCFCNQKYDRQMVSHFYDEFSISRAAGGICRGLPAAVYCRPSAASSDSWNRNANMRNHFYLPCLRVYFQRIPKSADKREISFIPDRRKKWFGGNSLRCMNIIPSWNSISVCSRTTMSVFELRKIPLTKRINYALEKCTKGEIEFPRARATWSQRSIVARSFQCGNVDYEGTNFCKV